MDVVGVGGAGGVRGVAGVSRKNEKVTSKKIVTTNPATSTGDHWNGFALLWLLTVLQYPA